MNSSKPYIKLSHSGKQHSYHVANALNQLGYLEKYHTSSYIKPQWLQTKLSNHPYWSRRFHPNLFGNKIDANWRFELKEIAFRKFLGKHKKVQEAVYARDIAFDKYVSRQIQKSEANIFWGFQGSCHDSLISAKNSELIGICELATAHITEAKNILGEEQRLHPEWADSIDNLIFPTEYEKQLIEEPHLADYVIAASGFTKKTLLNAGISEDKILYLPLGFDAAHFPFRKEEKRIKNHPLKLLYAGTVTQRKGIKYLLESMKQINSTDVELHILGGIQGSGEALKAYEDYFIYHPPVSQQEFFNEIAKFDVLVLPSIFEGFGLVIVEAMAAGLPVITTKHSIGSEIITNGENGFIVPIRNVGALQKAISNMRQFSDNDFNMMRACARKTAMEYSWDNYQTRLNKMLNHTFLGI